MSTNNSVNSPLSGTTGTGKFVGGNSPTITTPLISGAILDVNGNTILGFSPQASAVNYLNIFNNAAGAPVGIITSGADPTVQLFVATKGGVIYMFDTNSAANAALRWYNASSSNYTGLAAPTSPTGITFVLPSTDGSALNLWMKTDGSSNLSFGSPPGRYLNTQYLTSTGTYTPTAGTNTAKIRAIGGGGGGSGTGGAGVSGGGNGGNTTFNSTTVVAKGGVGAPNNSAGVGGSVGTGSLALAGSSGVNGQGLNANVIDGGTGGTGIFGSGAGLGGASTDAGSDGGTNSGGGGGGAGGAAAINSGGGGGGGSYSEYILTGVTGTYSYTIGAAGTAGSAGAGGSAGGAGGKGLIIIDEYS